MTECITHFACDCIQARVKEQAETIKRLREAYLPGNWEKLSRIKEENSGLRAALKAVNIDAIKCAESPSQYFITQWAMDKVEKALGEDA